MWERWTFLISFRWCIQQYHRSLGLPTLVVPSYSPPPTMEADEGRLEYDPPERMRRLPSWLAAELARRGATLVGEALAGEGVRRQHFAVLTSLAEQGAASQADIGRRL